MQEKKSSLDWWMVQEQCQDTGQEKQSGSKYFALHNPRQVEDRADMPIVQCPHPQQCS